MANLTLRETSTPGENRNLEIYTVVAVFLVLGAAGLGLRFASKRMLRKPLRIDDYLVVLAFVSPAFAFCLYLISFKYRSLWCQKARLSSGVLVIFYLLWPHH